MVREVALAVVAAAAAGGAGMPPLADAPPPPAPPAAVETETLPEAPAPSPATAPRPRSVAVGKPFAGRLRHGVQLAAEGPYHQTWDPILKQRPNRPWRRWATQDLLEVLDRVAIAYAERYPEAPPLLIGDLSRPKGGEFGRRFGGLGHGSHQNGLDADVYYPRKDGLPRAPRRPEQVDQRKAQFLVNRFLEADPEFVFVGPRLSLRGPRKVVVKLVHHDDHLHLRIRKPPPPS